MHDQHDSDPHVLQRVAREAEIVAQLRHPHIVRILDILMDQPRPVLVMEYIDGDSLSTVVREHGPLPVEVSAAIARDMASALAATHRAGIIHRDVKPANVLVDSEGQAFLTDFGIALASGVERFTSTGSFSGTAAYTAPELIQGMDPSAASDMWALGITLFETVTGATPFQGPGGPAGVLHRVMTDGPDLSLTPPALNDVLRRLLAKEPALRPDAEEARALLDGVVRTLVGDASAATTQLASLQPIAPTKALTPPHLGTSGTGLPNGSSARTRTSRRWVGISLAVILLVMAIGGSVLALLHGRHDPASLDNLTTATAPSGSAVIVTPSVVTVTTEVSAAEPGLTAGTSSAVAATPLAPATAGAATPTTPAVSVSAPAGTGTSGPLDEAQMKTVAQLYFDAALSDPPAAWAMLSPQYQQSIGGYSPFEKGFAAVQSITMSRTVYQRPNHLRISNTYSTRDGDSYSTTRDYEFGRRGDGSAYIVNAVKIYDSRGA